MLSKQLLDKATCSDYIKDILEYDNALCQCILSKFETYISDSEAFALLPSSVDVKDFGNFKEGGKFNNTAPHLSEYLTRECTSADASFILFDDVMAEPDDDYGEDLPGKRIVVSDQVYHLVDCARLDAGQLKKLIWACGASWHFVCVILSGFSEIELTNALKNADCDFVEKNQKELIVGAFDGDGYIHCRKAGKTKEELA